jgi:hypothetical protein
LLSHSKPTAGSISQRLSARIVHLHDHSTCSLQFSSNSRPLFRKPAMFHRVTLASGTHRTPDPDPSQATRHQPLLFHKPLSLSTVQSSIITTMADESTRSSAHSPMVQSPEDRGWSLVVWLSSSTRFIPRTKSH